MQARSAARRLALDILYEAEIRGAPPVRSFDSSQEAGWVIPTAADEGGEGDQTSEAPSDEVVAYARLLVTGVEEHHEAIDDLIARYADRWAIDRMPLVDRNVLRIAVFELLWSEDVPVAVAINEAVELAKSFSTDDSGRFVNGLLGKIAETARP